MCMHSISDIDECLRGIHDCHTAAICADSVGGFLCLCKPGYEGNGTFCASKEAKYFSWNLVVPCWIIVVTATGYANRFLKCIISPDVNECDRDAGCDTNAECTDTEGSYECHCNHGYSGDGFACTSKCDISWLVYNLNLQLTFTSLSLADSLSLCSHTWFQYSLSIISCKWLCHFHPDRM